MDSSHPRCGNEHVSKSSVRIPSNQNLHIPYATKHPNHQPILQDSSVYSSATHSDSVRDISSQNNAFPGTNGSIHTLPKAPPVVSLPAQGPTPIAPAYAGNVVRGIQTQLSQRHGTPAAFRGFKLRSGKWLIQEEKYADLLIRLFEKGLLPDCSNGTTLRAYLSLKLHCSPMRISKKFARKSIGKRTYTNDGSVQDISKVTARIRDAEAKFHSAVLKSQEFIAQLKSMAESMHMVSMMLQPPIMNSSHHFRPKFVQIPQITSNVPNVDKNLVMYPSGESKAQSGSTSMGVPTVASLPLPPPDQVNATTNPFTQQLYESYVNALKHPPRSSSITGPCNPKSFFQNIMDPMKAKKEMIQRNQGGSVGVHVSNRPPEATGRTCREPLISTASTSQERHLLSIPVEKDSINIPSDEFPDFLPGFDRVTINMKQSTTEVPASLLHVNTNVEPSLSQCSPTFTSRSFDDFHRFLGKDLSPLDEDKEISQETRSEPDVHVGSLLSAVPLKEQHEWQKTLCSATPTPHLPQMTAKSNASSEISALFTAESYAMFAQESALAASQHAAYLQPEIARPVDSKRSASFDLEGVMKLISENVGMSPTASLCLPAVRIHDSTTPAYTEDPSDLRESKQGVTPIERYYGSRRHPNTISEPSSTEASSGVESFKGSNDSNGSYSSNDSEDVSNDSETSESDSATVDEPPKKKAKSSQMENAYVNNR